jgi:hypothetical protein
VPLSVDGGAVICRSFKRWWRWPAVWLLGALLAAAGCEEPECPEAESIEVEETGSCAVGPQRFRLSSVACAVTASGATALTGLPMEGQLGMAALPLRQGDFVLFSDGPPARICRARRVEFRLELACFDGSGAPLCDAVLTEPTR